MLTNMRGILMRVTNIHERLIEQPIHVAGRLLSTLASDDDRIWPVEEWPRMKFDRPLQVGASGGHGPIRYFVEQFVPNDRVVFRFLAPKGFDGTHIFVVVPHELGSVLRHELRMKTSFSASWSWSFIYRPLHNALIKDALHKAAANFGESSTKPEWSWWVKKLRRWLK